MKIVTVENLKRILTCLFLTLFLVGCAKVPLYTNLGEREINDMMAILLRNGIDVSKASGTDDSWSLQVEQGRVSDAVEILNRNGLPMDQFELIGTVFKKSGLVSSPSEERIRFMYALSQGVAETLSNIDGVLTARVHIVLPDNDPLNEMKSPSSASIFIKYRRGSGVETLSSQIKRLVTNSIEGLEYDKVSIVFVVSDSPSPSAGMAEDEEDAMGMRILLIGGLVLLLLLIVGAMFVYWQMQNGAQIFRTSSTKEAGDTTEQNE